MIMITLRQIHDAKPCIDGWVKILIARGKITKKQSEVLNEDNYLDDTYHLADSVEFPFSFALESNGVENVIWAMRCLPWHANLWRKYAVWCARKVQHLMLDERSINALDVAWRHSDRQATDRELKQAYIAAYAAYIAANPVDAADAAYAAANAANAANPVDAAYAAYIAAYAAANAANAAYIAAYASTQQTQAEKLRQILDAGEWADDENQG